MRDPPSRHRFGPVQRRTGRNRIDLRQCLAQQAILIAGDHFELGQQLELGALLPCQRNPVLGSFGQVGNMGTIRAVDLDVEDGAAAPFGAPDDFIIWTGTAALGEMKFGLGAQAAWRRDLANQLVGKEAIQRAAGIDAAAGDLAVIVLQRRQLHATQHAPDFLLNPIFRDAEPIVIGQMA